MKSLKFKIIFILSIIVITQIRPTNSSYLDTETSFGNTMTAGCWSPPSAPTLIYPTDGYLAYAGSEWTLNPYMDWTNPWVCPGKSLLYQYESYRDVNLTILAYRSGFLNDSRIPAFGTPNGTYYWRARAFDGENWGNWSSVWLLTVDSTQSAPVLPLSSDNTELSVTLTPELNLLSEAPLE